MGDERALTVLVATRGLTWAYDEGTDVRQLLRGMVEAAVDAPGTRILGTDMRRVYRPILEDGEMRLDPIGPLLRWLPGGVDVAFIHYGYTPSHVAFGALIRLLGLPLVLMPDAVLTDDFAGGSWYADRGKLAVWGKHHLVRALRWAWRHLTALTMCTDDHEVHSSALQPGGTFLAPLAVPSSPLAESIVRDGVRITPDPDGPVAFISPMDVHRKGVDRMLAWVEAYRDELPRPAVMLLSPRDPAEPAGLRELVDDGLIEWHPAARGADVLPLLDRCRGTILLSRWNGYARALREAALLGLPILCTPSCNFADTIDVLGTGGVVDGDDVTDIQRGFTALSPEPQSAERARALLAPANIGGYLLQVFGEVADARPVTERSYYRWFDPTS